MLFKFVDAPAQTLALNMINSASRTIGEGIEATLLKYKWGQAGFDDRSLADALTQLLDDEWLEIHHPRDEPMLRFSPRAYEDFVRNNVYGEMVNELPERVNDPAERPLTEYELRQAVLDIYRELSLARHGQVPSSTLARFWREADRRSEDLRLALDILVRDGYLEIVRREFDTQFRLTTAGASYMDGPPAPDALVAQMRPADPLISRCPRLQDRALTRHLITRIHGPETVFDFKTLSTLWEQEGLHRDWLVLGCELLLKRGYFEVADARPLRLVLTERGASLRDHAMGRVSRLRDRLAVKQAVDDLHEALGQAD
ncbi:hypothetical protein [uncultured Abyssibacter sp.]|uniref:hypothetical protein n=1 Tax=uncultured Abyssibacter sp. TaxID=2320202 RepID=UPI0032B2F552